METEMDFQEVRKMLNIMEQLSCIVAKVTLAIIRVKSILI